MVVVVFCLFVVCLLLVHFVCVGGGGVGGEGGRVVSSCFLFVFCLFVYGGGVFVCFVSVCVFCLFVCSCGGRGGGGGGVHMNVILFTTTTKKTENKQYIHTKDCKGSTTQISDLKQTF